MKLKEIQTSNITIKEFKAAQWKRGLPLSMVGAIVYGVLRLFGAKPKDYYGICKYFEIGNNWGGLEMGWFFICAKNSNETLKNHEVGHGIQNALSGGFTMVAHSIGSALRYWYRKVRKITTPYDAWWFEGNATRLGTELVNRIKEENYGK
jgi:hypothetical protein